MRTIFKRAFMLGAMVLGLASCTKTDPNQGLPFTIKAQIEAATKSAPQGTWDGDEFLSVRVVRNDIPEIKKYGIGSNGVMYADASNAPFNFENGETSLSGVEIWYPYSAGLENIGVQIDQSDLGNYKRSAVLYSGNNTINAGENTVSMYHQTAVIEINIAKDGIIGSASEISEIKIGDNNLALSGTFTPKDDKSGSWELSSANGFIIPFATKADNAAAAYRAMSLPQNMEGKTLFSIKTASGKSFAYVGDAKSGNLKAGFIHTYDVTVYEDRIEVSFNGEEAEKLLSPNTLKPGDYFYSDGTWSDGGLRKVNDNGTLEWADTKPEPVSGKKVIGIVFSTNTDRMGKGEKEALQAMGVEPHGLVISTKSYDKNQYYLWYRDKDGMYDIDDSPFVETIGEDLTPSALYELMDADIEGYLSFKGLMDNRTAAIEAGDYKAMKAASNFATNVGGPDPGTKTTGWFIPSYGQYFDLFRYLLGVNITKEKAFQEAPGLVTWNNLGSTPAKLNEIMSKVPNSDKIEYPDYNNALWVTAQSSSLCQRYIDFTDSGYFDCMYTPKSTMAHLRCMLAF